MILLPQPGSPIAVGLRLHMGSMYDPDTLPGLAHFCEHMILAGTPTFSTKAHAAQYVEALGGRFWASTGYEDMGVFLHFADASDLPAMLSFLAEVMMYPTIRDEHVETERGAVESEMHRKESRPGEYVASRLHEFMYTGDALGHPILGTRPARTTYTSSEVRAFLERHVLAQNAVLSIAGDFDVDAALKEITRHLCLPQGASLRRTGKLAFLEQHERTMTLPYPQVPESYMALGYHTVSLTHSDNLPLCMLAELLGGGRSSLLIDRLRQGLGWVYDVSVTQHSAGLAGVLEIETSVPHAYVDKVLQVIHEIVAQIAEGQITPEQFHFVQSKMLKSRVMQMETSYARMYEASEALLFSGTYHPDTWRERIRQITPEDLARVARTYLHVKQEYVVHTRADASGEYITSNSSR